MGGKFSHKLEVLLPWILLNRNFLKRELAITPCWLGKFRRYNIFQTAFGTVCLPMSFEEKYEWVKRKGGTMIEKVKNGKEIGKMGSK